MLKAYGSYGLCGLILPIFYYDLFFLLQLIAGLNHITLIILSINSHFAATGLHIQFPCQETYCNQSIFEQIILLALREYSILLNL